MFCCITKHDAVDEAQQAALACKIFMSPDSVPLINRFNLLHFIFILDCNQTAKRTVVPKLTSQDEITITPDDNMALLDIQLNSVD